MGPRDMGGRERERDPRDRERDPRDRDPDFRRFDRERDSHYSSHHHHHPGGPGGDRGPHQDGGGPRDREHDRERERERDMRDGRGRDGPGRDMRDGRDERNGPMMRREDADARAVYIGGIPSDVSEAILGRLFASIGEVREAKVGGDVAFESSCPLLRCLRLADFASIMYTWGAAGRPCH